MNLELEGYQVTSAFDGVAAMKAVHNEYFDLIVLDVMIPEIDGFSVTQNIRLTNTEVPILILSAKDTSADRVLGCEARAGGVAAAGSVGIARMLASPPCAATASCPTVSRAVRTRPR